jgi:heme-degrading monooxygenase HmoA
VARYVIVWEFRIKPEAEAKFVEKYGPEGIWAKFFRGAQGYIRTELVRDVVDRMRLLTLDHWRSEEEFKRFREENLAEYKRLDRECEQLTEAETCLGTFWSVAQEGSSSPEAKELGAKG